MSLSNSQIDQLGERLRRCGALDRVSSTDLDLLEQWRQEHEELRPWLDWVLAAYDPDILSRSSRLKRIEAIFEKLQRQRRLRLSQMQDVLGFRLVVQDVMRQDELVDLLRVDFGRNGVGEQEPLVDDRRLKPSHG